MNTDTNFMKADIGIPEKSSQIVGEKLNKLLADEFILYTKTRNYHWNVEGINFMEMHKFYESLYQELEEVIDAIAERIRAIGHYSQGRLKDFIEATDLIEPDYTSDQRQQLTNLLDDHETIIRYLRREIESFSSDLKDAGTGDFVTGILKKHEKWAWFIRSYLK
jgi:starvation-inducible DNA-binding protein